MFTPRTSLVALQCSIACLAAGVAGCGGATGQQSCDHDDDCPSHFCKADGTCAAAGEDAPVAGDAPATGRDGTVGPGACTPDHDGHITESELPLIAGQMAKFRVSASATWSTAGSANGDGTHAWDLSGQLSGDSDITIALQSPAGAYWASDFPTATYATPLSASSDVVGVFALSATAVELLGVESPDSDGDTHLSYDPPAKILALPFSAGSTWSSTSTVTGTLQNVPSSYQETYKSSVDEVGTMKTPYGEFPVLRVATDLTDVQPLNGVTFSSSRTFAWVSECFGTVAKVTSQTFDTSAEFSNPADLERLTP